MVVAGEELTAHGLVDEGAKYLQRGRGWLEQQLKIHPGDVNHRYWMGSVLYDLAAWKESALVFRRLSAEAPDRLDYRGLAAVAAARTGDARAEDRLGDVNPSERGTLVMYRARLAAIRGDHDAALTLFSEAVRRGLRGLPWVHASAFRDLAPFRNDQKALPLSLRTETTPPATAP
jgi:tetratricopeptide (TPR) repeat protein